MFCAAGICWKRRGLGAWGVRFRDAWDMTGRLLRRLEVVQIGRAAGSLHGFADHHLGPSEVPVVELQQPAPVASDRRFLRRLVTALDHGFIYLLYVQGAQRIVMEDAQLPRRDGVWADHVLHPVGTIGDHHGNPLEAVVGGTALPLQTETENVPVERV